jgi:hypothetical protein
VLNLISKVVIWIKKKARVEAKVQTRVPEKIAQDQRKKPQTKVPVSKKDRSFLGWGQIATLKTNLANK